MICPIYVPVYNNPTYTRYFLNQLKNLNITDVIIVDNNSDFPEMIELLKELSKDYELIRLNENMGPHFILRDKNFYSNLPEIFCLSDPDIEFSKKTPNTLLSDLLEISQSYEKGKVGLALEIPKDEELNKPFIFLDNQLWKMSDWEKTRWENKIGKFKVNNDIYQSNLDTTFALYNKKFFDPENRYECIMVAGDYTVRHLGWYKKSVVPDNERLFYEKSTRYSYTAGNLNKEGSPVFEISVHEYTKMREEIDSLKFSNKILSTENIKLSNEIQKLYKSKSWKLTIPLRIISKIGLKLIFMFKSKPNK